MRVGIATDHGGFGLKEVPWDMVQTYRAAEFSQAERHVRRLGKVAAIEGGLCTTQAERGRA